MKIEFEYQTQYGVFRDALYLDDDHSLTQEQINDMQVERLNNWITFIETSVESHPETVELDGVTYEKVEIDGQIVLKPVDNM